MAAAFLVNINDANLSSLMQNKGKLKTLITDETFEWSKKFCDDQELPSFHRFLLTAQVADGMSIPTEAAERRYFIVRCLDELCSGHKEYFDHVWELVKDPVLVRDFYDFLMTRSIQKHIGKDDIPITQHQRELNEANRTPIEQWV
eukprot:2778222-Prymnesium_polylepis.1